MTTTTRLARLTQNEEAFALLLFSGKSQIDSYHLAYPKSQKWSDNAVYVAASRLANSTKVLLRIRELRDACEAPTIASETERKERLTDIYRANLVDFIDPESGEPRLSKNCPHHAAASEYSVSTRYTKKGDKVVSKSIKLHPPVPSIVEHNRMERIGTPENTQGGDVTINIQVNYPIGYEPKSA